MAKKVLFKADRGFSIAEKFHDVQVSHTVDLLRVSESIRERVVANLEKLITDLTGQLKENNLTSLGERRIRGLIRRASNSIFSAYRTNEKILKNDLRDLAAFEGNFHPFAMNSVLNADIISAPFTKKDLVKLADDTMIQGAPQQDWWARQSQEAAMRFQTQVRLGVAAGESNDQIVTRIIGSKTGRKRRLTDVEGNSVIVPEFRGGVMEVSKREATALVRTSVQTVSNQVLNETYEDNQDVLGGKQALATLDLRTSALCRGRDKAAWDFKGNPLPSSPVKIKFPGPPPWHFNCRTVLIPITKTWEELTGIKGIEEIPESTRASMNGQVAGEQTYSDWFKKQPVAEQKQVLGPGKWELWNKGKLTMAQMLDQSGNPLTIAQLREKVMRG